MQNHQFSGRIISNYEKIVRKRAAQMLQRGNFINKNKLIPTKEDPTDQIHTSKKAEAHNLAAEKNKEILEKARLDKIQWMQKWQIEKRQQED